MGRGAARGDADQAQFEYDLDAAVTGRRSRSPSAATGEQSPVADANVRASASRSASARSKPSAPSTRRSRRRASDSTSGCGARPPTCACSSQTTQYGAVSVRRRALVQHAVRPRRHHHRAPDAVDQPAHRARRARVSSRRRKPTASNEAQDAEPGKILHETRNSEMARARRSAVRPLLRQRGRDAAVRDAGRRVLATAPAIARSSLHIWPNVERALGWIDRLRRSRRRRVRRVRAPLGERVGAARLEGFARLDLPRRRHARASADRAVRGAGVRLRRAPPRRAHGRRARQPATARRSSRKQAERSAVRVRGAVLVRGHRHLRARARWTQGAVPRAELEPRPRALFGGIARQGARPTRRREARRRRDVLRLGHSHDRV